MDQHDVLQLIDDLETEIHRLVAENSTLKKKVTQLDATLAEKKADEDIFGNVSTNERIAMKTKVEQLIEKIDQQLQRTH